MRKTVTGAFAAVVLSLVIAAIQPSGGSRAIAGPYGDAGCGLGSIVLGSSPGFVQAFAATTNATFVSQTFGITTGTSNCVDGSPGVAGARSFSETNRAVVAKDMARGRGETIATLSALGGCQDIEAVGASLQKNFGRIAPDAQVSDRTFGRNVVAVLAGDSSLRCKKLASVASR